MAEFNPQTPDAGTPNFSGVSQGTGTNRTFETLFSGLTETVGNFVKVKDAQTQGEIQDKAQSIFDQTNQEFGVDAPSGLSSELETMKTLQSALEQGKISQVNYYGRLATLSKQLRTRYPGYESIVDQTIQSVTGTRPANAYRDAIFQELQNVQESASSEVKFKRQWEKENEAVIAALYGEDYFMNPEKYDFDSVRSKVSQFKGRKELIDSESNELTLMSKRGEFNDKRASRAIDRDFSFTVESVLNKSLGLNQPSAIEQINQFIASGGGDKTSLDQFITNVSGLEASLRAELTSKGRQKYTSSGILSADEVNKAVEAALFPIVKAKEAVLGGDFKLAAKYATLNKAITDQQLNEMMESSPEFKAGVGLSTVNQALGDQFFGERQNTFETLAIEVAGRAMAGQPDAVKRVVESGNQPVARQVVDESFRAITDPKLSGTNFSNLVDQLFGPQAIDFMSPKVVSADDLESVYLKFLRPEVTQAIVQRGSKEDLRKYTEWALDKVQAIPAFRAAAGNVNSLIASDPNVRVEFDPNNLRLKLYANNTGSTIATKLGLKPYARTVDAFNKAMVVLGPIFEANGEDAPNLAKEVVKSLNIDLENRDPQGFWNWILGQMDMSASAAESDSSSKEVAAEAGLDDGEMSFLFSDETDLEDGLSSPSGSVASAGKGYTTVRKEDGSTVRRTGTRAWRNNNPGNLEYGAFARQKGAIGSDGRFAVFPSYESGRSAKESLLFESASYRDKTIAAAISRYAPSSENDTGAYTRSVARAVGVPPSTRLSDLSKVQRKRLLDAMERIEGFKAGKEEPA